MFDWKIEKWTRSSDGGGGGGGGGGGDTEMEYWIVTTTDETRDKALSGGMMKRKRSQQPIINYIDIGSLDEYSSKIEKLGGKFHVPKMVVPGMGYFDVCLDKE